MTWWGGGDLQRVIKYFYGVPIAAPPPAYTPTRAPPESSINTMINKSTFSPLISKRDKPWLILKAYDVESLRTNVNQVSLGRAKKQDYLNTINAMDENPQFPLLFKAIEITSNPNILVRIDNPDGIINEIFTIDITVFHK